MQRLLILILAVHQAAAKAITLKYDPVGGDKVFGAGLSPLGAGPPTHYWCSWQMDDADAVGMRADLGALGPGVWIYNGDRIQSTSVETEHGLRAN